MPANIQQLDEVNAAALTNIKDLLKYAKTADDKNAVLLEKVASLTSELEKSRAAKAASTGTLVGVEAYIDRLADRGLIDARDAQGMVAEIHADPGKLVKLATSVIEITSTSTPRGGGISKFASGGTRSLDSEWEQDGWDEVIKG
jgi:hypothetical protein